MANPPFQLKKNGKRDYFIVNLFWWEKDLLQHLCFAEIRQKKTVLTVHIEIESFKTADFMKKVPSVYTHSLKTIYLSLSAQVAEAKISLHCTNTGLLDFQKAFSYHYFYQVIEMYKILLFQPNLFII